MIKRLVVMLAKSLMIGVLLAALVGSSIVVISIVKSSPRVIYNELHESVVIVCTESSYGSGIVIGDGTHILTALHVVKDGTPIRVINGCVDKAEIVYEDELHDLAVLKLEASKLKPVKLRSSKTLKIGERVYLIGNPGNLKRTLHTGLISGLNRLIVRKTTRIEQGDKVFLIPEFYSDVMQISSGVIGGFSGGGVFDVNGCLVGIVTMMAGDDISLAQPIDSILVLDIRRLGCQEVDIDQEQEEKKEQKKQNRE